MFMIPIHLFVNVATEAGARTSTSGETESTQTLASRVLTINLCAPRSPLPLDRGVSSINLPLTLSLSLPDFLYPP